MTTRSVYVRSEQVVQPRALRALFQHQVPLPRDALHRVDECLAVGLDREVTKALPRRGDNGDGAARHVDIQSDESIHLEPPKCVDTT